jgi:hypothetical protein
VRDCLISSSRPTDPPVLLSAAAHQLKPFASVKTPPDVGYPWGLPGDASRRAAWYTQMADEVPEWEDLRKRLQQEERPAKQLSRFPSMGLVTREEEPRP